MTTAMLIVAAGSGRRAGGDIPKQYRRLDGRSVLSHTIRKCLRAMPGDHIQLVIAEHHERFHHEAIKGLALPAPVIGGATRQASARCGLEALATRGGVSRVLIHDAVRPFLSAALIMRVRDALNAHEAVLPALPVTDSLKQVGQNGRVVNAPDRSGLWAVQTPQGFRFEPILNAHRRAHSEGLSYFSDDGALAQWAGLDVHIVKGERANWKLTCNADLDDAERKVFMENWLKSSDIRTGQGFDVHAFGSGNHVMLCGVTIPHEAGLVGHSDADVAIHALCDAVLGTIGEGDLGTHFPPDDLQWKGAASKAFLREVCAMVAMRDGVIANADVTVICEAPMIHPHVAAMRRTLAQIMNIETDRVSVKATTSERLGFIGRGEGIAALACVTIRLPFA